MASEKEGANETPRRARLHVVRLGRPAELFFLLESPYGGYCDGPLWYFAADDRGRVVPGGLAPRLEPATNAVPIRLAGNGIYGSTAAVPPATRERWRRLGGHTTDPFSDPRVIGRLSYYSPSPDSASLTAMLVLAREHDAWQDCRRALQRYGVASLDFLETVPLDPRVDGWKQEFLLRLRERELYEEVWDHRTRAQVLRMIYSEAAAVASLRWPVPEPSDTEWTPVGLARRAASRSRAKLEQCSIAIESARRGGWTLYQLDRALDRAVAAERELHAVCKGCDGSDEGYLPLDRAKASDAIWRAGAGATRDALVYAAERLVTVPGGVAPTLARVATHALLLSETVAFTGELVGGAPWANDSVLESRGLTAAWRRQQYLRLASSVIWRGMLAIGVGLLSTATVGIATLVSTAFLRPLRGALSGPLARRDEHELLAEMRRACATADPRFELGAPMIASVVLSVRDAGWPRMVFPLLDSLRRGEHMLLSYEAGRERD